MNKKENVKNLIRTIRGRIIPPLSDYLRKELRNCTSILDLGCGSNSPISQVPGITYSIGVDIYKPALDESKGKGIHSEYILSDITKVEFKKNSFDAVICLAVLEYLPKEEGLKLIKKMENWARKKIIIAVPNGYQYQDAYDGNPYQVHRSSWSVKEFKELGFKIYGMHGWKVLRGELGKIRFRPTLFWLLISDISQKLTYYSPSLASTLFAVKGLKNKG